MDKSPDAFRTISEAADSLKLPQHVLRFWETRFTQIKPLKRGGGRRYYRPEDVELLRVIRDLLYAEGYTIKGVQRILKERGAKGLMEIAAAPKAAAENAAPAQAPVHEPPRLIRAARGASARTVGAIYAALRELADCRRVLASAESQ